MPRYYSCQTCLGKELVVVDKPNPLAEREWRDVASVDERTI
jgi:hypothetical protein